MSLQRYLPLITISALVCAGLVALQAKGGPLQAFLSGEPTQAQPTSTVSPSIAPSPESEQLTADRQPPTAEPQAPIAQPTLPSLPSATVRRGIAANLRAAPSTQSAVIAVVMPGQSVQINVTQDKPIVLGDGVQWFPVVYGEFSGWMAGPLLEPRSQPSPTVNQQASVQFTQL